MTQLSTSIKDAFISYNKADEAWVKALAEKIENEVVEINSVRRNLSVFFAPWDIEFGANILNRIDDGLREAQFFLVVMSPEFFASGWTNLEWTDQVALNPKNANSRIIPLFYRDVSLDSKDRISFPPPFGVLNRLDFREPEDFEPAYRELIRILKRQPKHRGSVGPVKAYRPNTVSVAQGAQEFSSPSSSAELLIANSITIQELPSVVWSAATTIRKSAEIWQTTKTTEAFLLRDGNLYSFANVLDPACTLNAVIEKGTLGTTSNIRTWLANPEGRNRYVGLLNQCLSQYLIERKIGRDEKGRYYFWPEVGPAGVINTRRFSFGDEKPREVAAQKLSPHDGSSFWVHYAARIQFKLFGEVVRLVIEPSFIFTSDGRTPLDGKTVGKLAIQWTGKQKNPDVLRSVLFWTRVLADGHSQIKIPAGPDFIIARAVPDIAQTNFGIEGDYIRVQSLLQEPELTLDEISHDVELFDSSLEDREHNYQDETEEEGV